MVISAEQIGTLAALLTALAGVLTVVLVQARRVRIEDREQDTTVGAVFLLSKFERI